MPLLELGVPPERIHSSLPIHRLRHGPQWVYYTPGRVVVCKPADGRNLEAALLGPGGGPWSNRAAAELRAAATAALQRWREWTRAEFAPEALTAHLTAACNLSCGYCYSRRDLSGSAVLDLAVLRAAARMVAQSCAQHGRKSLPVAFHGGGEPTLDWARLAQAVDATRTEAERAGLEWVGYLATNGAFESSSAAWLARNFHSISVSCDGPPRLQDTQRPFGDSAPSSAVVERNLHLLVEAGANVSVRATVTRGGIACQPDIVAYLRRLGVDRISLEPVYRSPQQPFPLARDDAEGFVRHFLDAQQTGERCGCAVTTSCVRLDEIHGPYCDVLRHTLLVAPNGVAYPCAFRVGCKPLGCAGPDGCFSLDREQLPRARRRTAALPAECQSCINAYHCARGCPDVCYLSECPPPPSSLFRCRVAQLLTAAWVLGAVRSVQAEKTDGSVLGDDAPLRGSASRPLPRLGRDAEEEVNR